MLSEHNDGGDSDTNGDHKDHYSRKRIDIRPEAKADTREDVEHVFNLFDKGNTGKLSLADLKAVADELGENIEEEELFREGEERSQ